jgi:hypothetical protein
MVKPNQGLQVLLVVAMIIANILIVVENALQKSFTVRFCTCRYNAAAVFSHG